MPATALKRAEPALDPLKQRIIDKIGDLSGFEIAQNEVLLGIYMRDEVSPGGIIMVASTLKEDRFQGKANLVLKIGSACRFVRTDPNTGVTYGIPIAVHDWVMLRPSDTWAFDYTPKPESQDLKDFVPCRLVFDDQIRAKIPHPGAVW